MDNITHSLIGIAVGEAVFQYRAKKSAGLDAKLRPFYWLSSLIGNNIPDIDSLFAPILTGGKIGYLLHHRGYTHTLIFALPQAFFCLLALWLLTRYQKSTFSKKEWGIITLLSAFGVFTHIFADSWNSYGVHPFWPWNSRWFYGDTLFILEPWIWMCLLPALYFASFHKSQTK